MNAYDKAENRVKQSPSLSRHSDTILYDWPDGDVHWKWVATAPVKEIVSWAEHVESFQDENTDAQEEE